MKIERARREKTHTLTSISGASGSGKTYSAILYARGLVGHDGLVGFIDTENKRSRFYADVAGGFDVIDLDPPFTPERYIEAIRAFEAAGYGAIVIDSISHEWEGTGGILEQADAIESRTKKAGLHCWKGPKASHKKLMNQILQTKAHLIFCCRVKEKVEQVRTNGKTEIVSAGDVPVQEKSFIYEMSVSVMLASGSHLPTLYKCPGDLQTAFPEGQKITVETGAGVRRWSEQGEDIDREFAVARAAGVAAANEGTAGLKEWWASLDKPMQFKMKGLKESFKSIAGAKDMIDKATDEAGRQNEVGSFEDRFAGARSSQSPQDKPEGFDRSFIDGELRGAPETATVEETASANESGPHAGSETWDGAAVDGETGRTTGEGGGAQTTPNRAEPPVEHDTKGGAQDEVDPDAPAAEHEDAIARSPMKLISYARAMFLVAGGDGDAEKKLDRLEKTQERWRPELKDNLDNADLKKAQSIFKSAQAVATDKADLDAACGHFSGLLGCHASEIMPKGGE